MTVGAHLRLRADTPRSAPEAHGRRVRRGAAEADLLVELEAPSSDLGAL